MRKKLIHVVYKLADGGVAQGIATLVKNGFYDPFDFRLVELQRGHGHMRHDILEVCGQNGVISLREGEERPFIFNPAARHVYRMFEAMSFFKSLHSTFKNYKPDVVILSDPFSQVIGNSVASLFPKLKVINFEHGTPSYTRLWAWGLKLTSLRNNAVFGDTDETLRHQLSSGYLKSPRAAQTVPLAILEPDESRAMRNPDKFQILSVGRLSPEKNYCALVRAVVELMREGRDVELTIAGEGPQRQELEGLISMLHFDDSRLGIAGRIKLPGFMSEAELKPLRRAADIYIQPSRHEGFCLAAAEALAAGIPTITTNFSGARDYGNSKNLMMIEGYSSEDIAGALRRMIADYRTLAPGMSRAGRETVKALFGKAAVLTQWQKANAIMSSPKKPPLPVESSSHPKTQAGYGIG